MSVGLGAKKETKWMQFLGEVWTEIESRKSISVGRMKKKGVKTESF